MYSICVKDGDTTVKFIGCFPTREKAEVLLPKYRRTTMCSCYVVAIPS